MKIKTEEEYKSALTEIKKMQEKLKPIWRNVRPGEIERFDMLADAIMEYEKRMGIVIETGA